MKKATLTIDKAFTVSKVDDRISAPSLSPLAPRFTAAFTIRSIPQQTKPDSAKTSSK
jgi:hypothetical protein